MRILALTAALILAASTAKAEPLHFDCSGSSQEGQKVSVKFRGTAGPEEKFTKVTGALTITGDSPSGPLHLSDIPVSGKRFKNEGADRYSFASSVLGAAFDVVYLEFSPKKSGDLRLFAGKSGEKVHFELSCRR